MQIHLRLQIRHKHGQYTQTLDKDADIKHKRHGADIKQRSAQTLNRDKDTNTGR